MARGNEAGRAVWFHRTGLRRDCYPCDTRGAKESGNLGKMSTNESDSRRSELKGGIMTKKDKKRFIRELIQSVTKEILDKVDKMPEEWDGHELRQFLADNFQDCSNLMRKDYRSRYRAYKNKRLVNNL